MKSLSNNSDFVNSEFAAPRPALYAYVSLGTTSSHLMGFPYVCSVRFNHTYRGQFGIRFRYTPRLGTFVVPSNALRRLPPAALDLALDAAWAGFRRSVKTWREPTDTEVGK